MRSVINAVGIAGRFTATGRPTAASGSRQEKQEHDQQHKQGSQVAPSSATIGSACRRLEFALSSRNDRIDRSRKPTVKIPLPKTRHYDIPYDPAGQYVRYRPLKSIAGSDEHLALFACYENHDPVVILLLAHAPSAPQLHRIIGSRNTIEGRERYNYDLCRGRISIGGQLPAQHLLFGWRQ